MKKLVLLLLAAVLVLPVMLPVMPSAQAKEFSMSSGFEVAAFSLICFEGQTIDSSDEVTGSNLLLSIPAWSDDEKYLYSCSYNNHYYVFFEPSADMTGISRMTIRASTSVSYESYTYMDTHHRYLLVIPALLKGITLTDFTSTWS